MTFCHVGFITSSITRLMIACSAAVAFVGCSHDNKSLDEFSRAYTEFCDRAAETDTCARMPVDPQSRFWTSLVEAMNTRVTNASRARAAAGAIAVYQAEVAPVMAVCAEYVQKMDTATATLIEAANRINNDQIRSEAVGIAQSARAAQVAYSSLLPLYQRRFELQMAVLNDEVRAEGFLSRIPLFQHRANELSVLMKDCDRKWQEAATASQSTQDAFSALKGQTNLKTYPGKSDLESPKPAK